MPPRPGASAADGHASSHAGVAREGPSAHADRHADRAASQRRGPRGGVVPQLRGRRLPAARRGPRPQPLAALQRPVPLVLHPVLRAAGAHGQGL